MPSREAEGELGWSRPLGYESSEHRSAGCSPVRKQPSYRGLGCLPTGNRPALFLAVSVGPVSKSWAFEGPAGRREAADRSRGPPQSADRPAPEVLGEELVSRVQVLREQPRFDELAVADVAHEHVPVLKGSPLALAATDIDRDRMVIIGHDVVDFVRKVPPVSSAILAKEPRIASTPR